MSQDINSGVVVGRVCRDAELRYTASGAAICTVSIATNKRVKKGDQWEDATSFIDLTLWGKQAEGINKYLTKGQQVAVHFSLEQQRWEKDGQKHSKLALCVEDIQLLGGKRDADALRQDPKRASGEAGPSGPCEDDIPFSPHYC